MTSLAHVRTAVQRLAEVARTSESGCEAWAVAGEVFVTITQDRTAVHLRLPADDARCVLDDIPGSRLLQRGSEVVGVTIGLGDMNGMQANAVLGRAWAHRAPQRLVRPPEVAAETDLPASIGRPATRALHGAGITTLDGLSEQQREQIAALHGVGPKALRILGEALAERGLDWVSSPDRGDAG